MYKISYDPDVKILTIRVQRGKSADSEIKGNIVFDYNNKVDLIKIEVMDVNLEDLVRGSVPLKKSKYEPTFQNR